MELFYQWIRDVLSVLQKNEDTDPKRIAIDGKAVRAAAANGRGIPYIISAYLGNYGLSIGQLKVGEKTNEIKEIPKLLKKLDISNCVITIDAIGCQKPIAKQIVEQKGHYCLAVKTNQPLLYEEVKEYFSYAEKEEPEKLSTYRTIEKNHGRIEKGFTKQINAVENESSDLIIFIPKNRYFAKNKQLAYDSLSHVLNHDNLQQLNIQYIEYSETEYFSYLDTSRINGIEKSKNPIIIYQANKDLAVNGGYLESYKAGAVLFQCDEKQLRNISKKYEDMLGNYQLVITNVHEQYLYNHTFLIKLVGFLSSLCTIVLLLNIMIIVTVSRLEFRENAMKISLMKIFGYSLFERHKTLLKMIVVENFVILVGMLIYSLLSVQTEVGISILVSSFMALIEFTIIFFNITIVEKTNIPKSLKGGCL